MYCPNCGKGNIEENAKFCPFCGTSIGKQEYKKPEGYNQNHFKKSMLSILLSVLIVILASILYWRTATRTDYSANGNWVSEGLATPEALVEQFGQYMANGNIEGMLSLFGTSKMSERYMVEDLRNSIFKYGIWNFSSFTPYENIYKYLSTQRMYSENILQVKLFALALVAEPEALTNLGKLFATQEAGKKWMDTLILNELDTFKILKVDQISANEDYKQYTKDYHHDLYKADDAKCLGVLCEYAGRTYGGIVTVVKYDDKWYLQDLMGNTIYRNVLQPMELSEYNILLQEANDECNNWKIEIET